jgi:type I restriction enzyme R subunit
VKFIERNTYELFDCENGDPTSAFDFNQAIDSKPPTSFHSG